MVISNTDQARTYSMDILNKTINAKMQKNQQKLATGSMYSLKTEMLEAGEFYEINTLQDRVSGIEDFIQNNTNTISYMKWVDFGIEHLINRGNEFLSNVIDSLGVNDKLEFIDDLLKKLGDSLLRDIYSFMTSPYSNYDGKMVFGEAFQEEAIGDFKTTSNLDNDGKSTTNYINDNLLKNSLIEILPGYCINCGIDPNSEAISNLIGGIWKVKSGKQTDGYSLLKKSVDQLAVLRAEYRLKIQEVEGANEKMEEQKVVALETLGEKMGCMRLNNLTSCMNENNQLDMLYTSFMNINLQTQRSLKAILLKLLE